MCPKGWNVLAPPICMQLIFILTHRLIIRGRGRAFPALFWKMIKFSDFGKMVLIVSSFELIFHSKCDCVVVFVFTCVIDEVFIKVSSFDETSTAVTSFFCPLFLSLRHCSFWKRLHLKCLIGFWVRICLNNFSVSCTVTLCYVLHQTHSGFWFIRNSIYSRISRYIQGYSALLRHIRAYWDTAKAYSDLFRHIQHP